MPEIVNVVAAGSVGRELDVAAVAEDIDAGEVKSNTDEYSTPTVYLREREGGPLVTVYESGSFHVSGASSVKEADEVVEWFVGALESLGVEGVDVEYGVKNVVVVGDLERSVDLNRLAVILGFESVEYEPEQFPGMVYRPPESEAVYLIFASGRVVIPGSSSAEVGFEAFEELRERLSNFS